MNKIDEIVIRARIEALGNKHMEGSMPPLVIGERPAAYYILQPKECDKDSGLAACNLLRMAFGVTKLWMACDSWSGNEKLSDMLKAAAPGVQPEDEDFADKCSKAMSDLAKELGARDLQALHGKRPDLVDQCLVMVTIDEELTIGGWMKRYVTDGGKFRWKDTKVMPMEATGRIPEGLRFIMGQEPDHGAVRVVEEIEAIDGLREAFLQKISQIGLTGWVEPK